MIVYILLCIYEKHEDEKNMYLWNACAFVCTGMYICEYIYIAGMRNEVREDREHVLMNMCICKYMCL